MKLKTITIRGNEYVQVHERIRAFHELFPKGYITTEIVNQTDTTVLIKATVYPEAGRYFTGHAFEKNSGGMVNATSHVENCETSAVGRALGFLGIGVETSIATAEEVSIAIKKQETPRRYRSYNGIKYPHVTDILNPDPLPIPDWHKKVGTEIDLYMKAFFTKKPYIPSYEGLEEEAKKNLDECIEAAQVWLLDFGSDIKMTDLDVILINNKDIYTGTDDLEGVFLSKNSIIDFKKTKDLTAKMKDHYFMQLAAYAKADRFDKKPKDKIEQLVIASPFNDPVTSDEIDRYYDMFLEKRAEYKKRFGF